MSQYAEEFGKHVRSLRRARALTQEKLAERAGLSVDTIRRMERGSFSASIDTVHKLCGGLGIAPSTLWESFEMGDIDERRELLDLIASRPAHVISLVTRVVRVLLDELDRAPP